MDNLICLARNLYEEDLNWSSLFISEYLYKKTKSSDAFSLIINNLFKLGCYIRCIHLIEENASLFPLFKKIYFRCKHMSGDKEKSIGVSLEIDNCTILKDSLFKQNRYRENLSDTSSCENSSFTASVFSNKAFDTKTMEDLENNINFKSMRVKMNSALFEVDKKSVELFFEALTKSDVLRINLLKESFKIDNKNLESLFFLIKDELISYREFKEILNEVDGKYKEMYKEIFNDNYKYLIDPDEFYNKELAKDPNSLLISSHYNIQFYNPYYIFLYSRYLYNTGNIQYLFNLSFTAFKLYPNTEYTYISLGLYFLLLKNFSEARRSFLKAFEINNKSGHVFLYLGICYAGSRECENAISCLIMSRRIMIGSWKPNFYLAFEYQKMTNYEKASYYYKEGLLLDRNNKIQQAYVSLLIFCEYYTEALSYLVNQNNPEHNLLRAYCLLFLGKVEESKVFLRKCEKDWRYYSTYGYMQHLLNNLEKSADAYSRSLILHHTGIVEELLGMAVDNIISKKENDVYNYCTELFENIFVKTQEYDVI